MIPASSIFEVLIRCHSISLGVYNGSLAMYGLEPDLVGIAWQTKSVASSCRTSSRNMSLHVYRIRSIRILSSSGRCDPTLNFDDANQAVTSASEVIPSIVLRASRGLRLVGDPIEGLNASSFSSSDSGRLTKFTSFFSLATSPSSKQARAPRSNSWIQISRLLQGIRSVCQPSV